MVRAAVVVLQMELLQEFHNYFNANKNPDHLAGVFFVIKVNNLRNNCHISSLFALWAFY
jgi:hypothetical protein